MMALKSTTCAISLVIFALFFYWNVVFNGKFLRSNFSAAPLTDLDFSSSTIVSSNSSFSTALAASDSLGFFLDIPDEQWKIQKQIALSRRHIHIPRSPLSDSRQFYQENWDPDFSCACEDKIGRDGDGHKWVCDPHRIKRDCIVYSIGCNGDFSFEQALQKRLPFCEIHVFDFTDYSWRVPFGLKVEYHTWGLKPFRDENLEVTQSGRYVNNTVWRRDKTKDWKTFPEIVELLGHQGKVIDIFKIDCEGCEYYTYKDWFSSNVMIRQLLVEVHGTPPIVNDFFKYIHDQSYSLFHKEPNIMYGGGENIEFCFLKMSPSFFGQ
jgi:hypothetical protein